MKISDKISNYIIYAIFIAFFSWLIIKSYQFHKHYAFAVGIVENITPPEYKASGDYSIIFHYNVDGKEYRGNNDYNFCSGQNRDYFRTLLIGKKFPVVYGTKSPSAGFMLLSQDYANKFKYTLLDSVKHYDSIIHCIQ